MAKKIIEPKEEQADPRDALVELCRKMVENRKNDFLVRALLNDVKAVLEKMEKMVV